MVTFVMNILEAIIRFWGVCFGLIRLSTVEQRLKRMSTAFRGSRLRSCFSGSAKQLSIGLAPNLYGTRCIHMGDNVSIGHRVTLTAWHRFQGASHTPEIIIGDSSSIGDECHITAIRSIRLGKGVLFGKMVTVTDNSHGSTTYSVMELPPMLRPLESKGPVIIEDNVWIGDKSTILPGVTIGKGAIIGANSVVTKNVLPYAIVAGNPARQIKQVHP